MISYSFILLFFFYFVGRVCVMFNRYLKGILRIEGKNCNECLYNYSFIFVY